MDEMQNVAANEVDIATPQAETAVETSTETTEVQQTTETAKPDVTETQAFSARLKEQTNKAVDQEYSRLYGSEYGIHSKADYDQRISDQKEAEERERIQEQTGIDPDNLKPIFEQWKKSDPDFQELSRTRADNNVKVALNDLNSELKDAGIDLQLNDLSDTEITKLPNIDKITEYVKQGQTLANAFFLANKKDIIAKQTAKAEQETIKKITANGASSPGSLASGVQAETFFTKEQVEKMTKDDVMKNYATIIKSTPKW